MGLTLALTLALSPRRGRTFNALTHCEWCARFVRSHQSTAADKLDYRNTGSVPSPFPLPGGEGLGKSPQSILDNSSGPE